jgi:hypothetical protein
MRPVGLALNKEVGHCDSFVSDKALRNPILVGAKVGGV